MNKSILARLEVLQTESGTTINESEALKLIRKGLFYDDLTDEQKDIYFKYKYPDPSIKLSDRHELEELEYLFLETLHFPLEEREIKTLEEKIIEVEEILNQVENKPISHEELERESREFDEREREIEHVKELRRNARKYGKTAKDFPMPWEKGYKKERNVKK